MSFFPLTAPYRGRFAPTPSGPLHAGSLVTALAGWLDARAARGRWLLRIDDLDKARCPPGMEATILRQLELHGLTWDEAPRHQSRHIEAYHAALQTLDAAGRVYRCRCTRAQLLREAGHGADGPVYSGRCRELGIADGRVSLRLRMGSGSVRLDDPVFGTLTRDLQQDIGDPVLKRSDGVIGYHLACVVDETAQHISHVVRGADLIGASLAQHRLMQDLQRSPPRYAHVPLLVDARGNKLSKQNHAAPLDDRHPAANLHDALLLLGQSPPAALDRASVTELLDWAVAHWDARRIPRDAQVRLG